MSNQIVYTPLSPVLRPVKLLKSMFLDLKRSRVLAERLIIREISAQYRQTFFGYLWAIIPPMFAALPFIFLQKANVLAVKDMPEHYPVFVFVGTIFFQLFVDSLRAPLREVATNRSMITKIDFPKEALILSGVGQVLFSFFIKLALLFVILLVFRFTISRKVVLLVLPIIGLITLGTLIGVFLVPLGVLYRDVQNALDLSVAPLLFLTPAIYMSQSEGWLAAVARINPLTPLITAARHFLFTGSPQSTYPLFLVLLGTCLLLFFGWIIYKVAFPIIVERIEA